MRVLDFLNDVRDTSQRIAERDAFLDMNTTLSLTLKTLMRPDATAYFDSVLLASQPGLAPVQRLMGWLCLFAYCVNIRPRPVHADVQSFGDRLASQLAGLDPNVEPGKILCASPRIRVPGRLIKMLEPLVRLDSHAGFYAHFGQDRPSDDIMARLASPAVGDASLLLWRGGSNGLPAGLADGARVVFHGPLYTSNRFSMSALYLSAID